MKTNEKTPVIGYFLLFEEEGGLFEDTWSRDIRSLFVEKNLESEKVIKGICKEYDVEDYELHDLMDHIDKGVGIYSTLCDKDSDFYNGRDPHTLNICLYSAVKIGEEVFKKVSIIDFTNANKLEKPPE